MFPKARLAIDLVEPVIYLRGRPKDQHTTNILRGLVRLDLSHPADVHSVTIQFVGTAETMWPEAAEHYDKHVLVDSLIPICGSTTLKRGSHTFPFEMLLSNALSESIECGLGHVRYLLYCRVHFKSRLLLLSSSLKKKRAVVLVRMPTMDTPRCITQTHAWDNNRLNLVVETAHITPGSELPLSLHLARPIRCIEHLEVKLIERQKYRAPTKHSTRILHHEITLAPQRPFTLSSHGDARCLFLIPDKHTLKVHPTTTNRNIRVRHWIQVCLRLVLDDTGAQKELLLDAPVSVLLNSIDDYTTLPVYQPVQCTTPAPIPLRPIKCTTEHQPSFVHDNEAPPSYDDIA